MSFLSPGTLRGEQRLREGTCPAVQSQSPCISGSLILASLVHHHTVSRETRHPSPPHPDTVLVGTAQSND